MSLFNASAIILPYFRIYELQFLLRIFSLRSNNDTAENNLGVLYQLRSNKKCQKIYFWFWRFSGLLLFSDGIAMSRNTYRFPTHDECI